MSLKRKLYGILPMNLKIKYDISKMVKKYKQKEYEVAGTASKIYIIGESDNGNVGDLAITLSHYMLIRKNIDSGAEIVRILYSEFWEYFWWLKRHIHPNDLITIPGGGNIGDVYVEAEEIRQVIINEFPNNQVIIFPSTVYFRDVSKEGELYRRSCKIYNEHKNVKLYVREKYSYEFVKKNYPNCNVELLPDIVLGYDFHEKYARNNEILLCFRNDAEKMLTETQVKDIYKICKTQCDKVTFTDTFVPNVYAKHDTLRRKIVTEKLNEFSKARLIITDRLHGMILAYISKTPCIVLSNNNYKIRGVYSWIEKLQWIKYVENSNEIEAAIKKVEKHSLNKEMLVFDYGAIVNQLKQWEKEN